MRRLPNGPHRSNALVRRQQRVQQHKADLSAAEAVSQPESLALHRRLDLLLRFCTTDFDGVRPADLCQERFSLLKNLRLDGLDIGWQYPKSDVEVQNFVKLLHATHQELRGTGTACRTSHTSCSRLQIQRVADPAGSSNLNIIRTKEM